MKKALTLSCLLLICFFMNQTVKAQNYGALDGRHLVYTSTWSCCDTIIFFTPSSRWWIESSCDFDLCTPFPSPNTFIPNYRYVICPKAGFPCSGSLEVYFYAPPPAGTATPVGLSSPPYVLYVVKLPWGQSTQYGGCSCL